MRVPSQHVLVSVRAAVCVIVTGAVSVTHAQDSPDIPVRSQPVEDPLVSEALSLVGQCYARTEGERNAAILRQYRDGSLIER